MDGVLTMSDLRAKNGGFGSSLLDKSTAKPGSVDMSIFGPKSTPAREGTTSSDYLKRTREEDPWPADSGKSNFSLVLSECKFVTPVADLAIGKPFEASCRCQAVNNCSPTQLRATFQVKMKFTLDGKDQVDEEPTGFDALLKFSQADQVLAVKGNLPAPPSSPPTGIKIKYQLVATHPEAEKPDTSPEVELSYLTNSDCVSFGEDCFRDTSPVPVLDASGGLISALCHFRELVRGDVKGEWIVFGHRSSSESDTNDSLSANRARLVKHLLLGDAKSFGKLASSLATVSDLQASLKGFSEGFSLDCDPGKIDGIEGPKTKAAIRHFQESRDITADGMAGPVTWAEIGQSILDLVAESQNESEFDMSKIEFGPMADDGIWGCLDPNSQGEGSNWSKRGVDVMWFADETKTDLSEEGDS